MEHPAGSGAPPAVDTPPTNVENLATTDNPLTARVATTSRGSVNSLPGKLPSLDETGKWATPRHEVPDISEAASPMPRPTSFTEAMQMGGLMRAPKTIQVGGTQRNLKGEDRFATRRVVIGEETLEFGVVADGHGGSAAAALCHARCIDYIVEEAKGDASSESLRRAGRAAFERLHAEVRGTGRTDGTTLTVCIINMARGELTTVNVGDSAAILVHHQEAKGDSSFRKQHTQRLTGEHRLQDSERERTRVTQLGGIVARVRNPVTGEPGGPLRAFPGGLAIARGIGDSDAGQLVSCRPATSTVPLSPQSGWDVVLASDGVWDGLLTSAVIKLVRNSAVAPPAKTADLIVDGAVAKRHAFDNSGFKVPRDDTTCIIMRQRGAGDAEGGGGCLVRNCEQMDLSLSVVEPTILGDYVNDDEASEGLTVAASLPVSVLQAAGVDQRGKDMLTSPRVV